MRAVILAGGEGTRLRPLTLARAKPVVPLLNRPFLDYQLALLRDHGIADVTLACSYRIDDVRKACGDGSALGVRLEYAVETQPLGTGGGVRNAVEPGPGAVCVLNGDVLTDADLTAMRAFHRARGSRATIFLTRVTDPRQYGLVETDGDGRILRFREKPSSAAEITTDTVNAGIYMLDAALLARIPTDRPVSIEREFFPALIDDGIPFFGWCAAAYWRDIGSPAAYRAAQMDLLERRVLTSLLPPENGPRATAGGARVEAPSLVAEDVQIEPGGRVGPLAVIGAGSRVGARASIEASVLWERVEVGPSAVLREAVVGSDVKIGAFAELGPGAVVASGTVVTEHERLPR